MAIEDLDEMAGVTDRSDHQEMALWPDLDEEQGRPPDRCTLLREHDRIEWEPKSRRGLAKFSKRVARGAGSAQDRANLIEAGGLPCQVE